MMWMPCIGFDNLQPAYRNSKLYNMNKLRFHFMKNFNIQLHDFY